MKGSPIRQSLSNRKNLTLFCGKSQIRTGKISVGRQTAHGAASFPCIRLPFRQQNHRLLRSIAEAGGF